MTKDEALVTLWEARSSLVDLSLANEIADAFKFPRAKVPFKDAVQLRREGLFIDMNIPSPAPGMVSLAQGQLPEGVLTCELAEVLCGIEPPTLYIFSKLTENMAWRTERALVKGHGWKPTGPGRLFDE